MNAKKWAEAVQKVLKIPEEVLIDNAKYISNISSSTKIDNEYYKKINQLIYK